MLLEKAEGHSPESSQRVYDLTSALSLDPQGSCTLPPISASAKSWPNLVLEFLRPDVGLVTPCSTSKAKMQQRPRLIHSPNVLSSHHFKGGN